MGVLCGIKLHLLFINLFKLHTELQKVPTSASVLVRKDFGIRENLRKASGGKKLKFLQF